MASVLPFKVPGPAVRPTEAEGVLPIKNPERSQQLKKYDKYGKVRALSLWSLCCFCGRRAFTAWMGTSQLTKQHKPVMESPGLLNQTRSNI